MISVIFHGGFKSVFSARPRLLRASARVTVYGGKVELVKYQPPHSTQDYYDAPNKSVFGWQRIRCVLVCGAKSDRAWAVSLAMVRYPSPTGLQTVDRNSVVALGLRMRLNRAIPAGRRAVVEIRWE